MNANSMSMVRSGWKSERNKDDGNMSELAFSHRTRNMDDKERE